jgi:hypothetical protein
MLIALSLVSTAIGWSGRGIDRRARGAFGWQL